MIFTKCLLRALNLRQFAKAAAQPVISNTSLKDIIIFLPPLSLQEQFAERIEAIELQKKTVIETTTTLKTLLDSRMDYYFS